MEELEYGCVVTLTDFNVNSSSSSEACSMEHLQVLNTFLKRKFREPTTVEYSGRFVVEKTIEVEGKSAYNCVIVSEYNLLMLICDDGMANFYDLDSYRLVSSINFEKELNTICLERTPSQLNVIIGASGNTLLKHDLKKILESSFDISNSLIWEKNTKCEFLWGINSMKDQLIVVDYNGSVHIHNSINGDHISAIFEHQSLVDLKFLPNGDFIACGNKYIGIVKKDKDGYWNVSKEITSPSSDQLDFNRCFSIFYEEKSEKIYVSDPDGKLLVFTKDLVHLSTHKLEILNDNYCITINEKNGKMIVCNVGKNQLLILN